MKDEKRGATLFQGVVDETSDADIVVMAALHFGRCLDWCLAHNRWDVVDELEQCIGEAFVKLRDHQAAVIKEARLAADRKPEDLN